MRYPVGDPGRALSVRSWPRTDQPVGLAYVRYPGYSGKDMLVLSLTGFDPERNFATDGARAGPIER
jgi:hypothetical protein